MNRLTVGILCLLMVTSVAFAGGQEEKGSMGGESATEAFPFSGMLDGVDTIFLVNEMFSEWQTANSYYLQGLIERAGGTCKVFDPEGSADNQLPQADDAFVLKPDILYVKPVDGQAIVPSLKRFNEAGIPIIAIDMRPAEGVKLLTHITTDQIACGSAAADYISKAFKKKGGTAKVVSIVGELAIQVGQERRQGLHDRAAQLGNIQIIDERECKWSNDLAYNAMLDVIERFPDIDAIVTQADAMVTGIISALKSKDMLHPVGDDKHIIICSMGGDATGLKYVREGLVDFIAEVNAALLSDIAVKVTIDHLNGKAIPNPIKFPPHGITKDTMDAPLRWGNFDLEEVKTWPVLDHDVYKMQTK